MERAHGKGTWHEWFIYFLNGGAVQSELKIIDYLEIYFVNSAIVLSLSN